MASLPSLSSPLSPPLMRLASLGFWIRLDGRHRGARVPRTDIKRHANRAVFHDFLGGEIFGVVVSLIVAKKTPWQSHCARPDSTGLITKRPVKSPRLTTRGTQGTPARPSNTGARSITASANATAAPHASERASERAPSQRAARACVRGGGTENGDDARDAR